MDEDNSNMDSNVEDDAGKEHDIFHPSHSCKHERRRRPGPTWREVGGCLISPAVGMALLLLLAYGPTRALSQWPICYDYWVPTTIGEGRKGDSQKPGEGSKPSCPDRSYEGVIVEGTKKGTSPCYHTTMWDVTSPRPTCRNLGCQSSSEPGDACCCGASQGANRVDPFLQNELCGEKKFGYFDVTGASAGSCPACTSGTGADNGVGGRILEVYGDPDLREKKILDYQVFGHVYDLDYKLASCSTAARTLFDKLEKSVNEACDVKTYYKLLTCGNCAKVSSRLRIQLLYSHLHRLE